MARIPKGCHVRSIVIETKGAEVSYDCGGEGGGGRGTFPLTRGQQGFSTYPKAWFPKVREVTTGDHGESHTSGIGAHVSFQLIPEASHCKVRRSGAFKTLVCTRIGRKFKKRKGY